MFLLHFKVTLTSILLTCVSQEQLVTLPANLLAVFTVVDSTRTLYVCFKVCSLIKMPLQLCNFPMPRVLHKSLEYKCSLFAHFICVTHGRRPPRIVDRTSFCACGPNCAALLSQLMWIDCADLLNNPRVSLCCIMIVALGQIGHFSQTQITGARWMPYSYYYSQKK